jgi:DNA-binding CsgD family transcriptional regulator
MTNRLGRVLALLAVAFGALSAVAAFTIPRADGRVPAVVALAWLALALIHGAIYWWGDAVRGRVGATTYLLIQGALVFAIGAAGALYPLGAALYIALSLEAVSLVGDRFGVTPIAVVLVVLFSLDAIIVESAYVGASRGLMLLAVVLVVHAAVRLLEHRRRSAPRAPAVAHPPEVVTRESELTPREDEVLRALVRGARTAQIAETLGISERTVKAHLASIYQKLGVESRTAAVAVALRRGLG